MQRQIFICAIILFNLKFLTLGCIDQMTYAWMFMQLMTRWKKWMHYASFTLPGTKIDTDTNTMGRKPNGNLHQSVNEQYEHFHYTSHFWSISISVYGSVNTPLYTASVYYLIQMHSYIPSHLSTNLFWWIHLSMGSNTGYDFLSLL